MSGFAGIVNLSGAPIDAELLAGMTDSLVNRGPDARGLWHDGCAGLGHTLFRTTDEAASESQPLSFDGKTWIVADARVDARAELVASLRAAGRDASMERPDVELILHAWHAWGEDCASRLMGDFAFAIWDAGRKRLHCARDPLGIKPFFFAHVGDTVVFSNSLACVRRHPAVSARLDDLAIADFLILGYYLDGDATAFADIRRLLPAHFATWTAETERQSRYWTLPIEEPLYLRRREEYPEQFAELLRVAVRDRTRTDRVGILMSGGLDSTLLASFTQEALRKRRSGARVASFTSLLGPDDEERLYAAAVATHLGICASFFEDPNASGGVARVAPIALTAEPNSDPGGVAYYRGIHREMARHGRVAFYGEGPDNALKHEWKPYLAWLWQRRKFARLVRDVLGHVTAHRRIPLIPTLASKLVTRKGPDSILDPFPTWLNPGLVTRLDLRERWRKGLATSLSCHPLRPESHGSFALPLWMNVFGALDHDYTEVNLEFRHPYLDIRLLRFMLRVPALPWCRAKFLMREVARSRLPEEVRRRPKTPIAGSPFMYALPPLPEPDAASRTTLARYLNTMEPDVPPDPPSGSFWVDIRPGCLAAWLREAGAE